MSERLRILPVVIIATALLFGLKLDNIWRGAGDLMFPATLAETAAESDAGPAAQDGAAGAVRTAAADGTVAAEAADTADGVPASRSAPTQFNQAEIEVLQSLSKRRDELDARARDLQLRENVLKATEKRIDGKIVELKALEDKIQQYLQQHDAQSEAQLKSLVKVYENMKPKDAARIFEQLDMVVLLDVIERMKERKSAPILAKMKPQRAKEITLELAQRRGLPVAQN